MIARNGDASVWWRRKQINRGARLAEYEFLTTYGHASGELEGVGTWRLYKGDGVAVVYDWRVRTTKPWMNVFGPLARPAFSWNHDVVMRQGGRGLAAELGATLLLCD